MCPPAAPPAAAGYYQLNIYNTQLQKAAITYLKLLFAQISLTVLLEYKRASAICTPLCPPGCDRKANGTKKEKKNLLFFYALVHFPLSYGVVYSD